MKLLGRNKGDGDNLDNGEAAGGAESPSTALDPATAQAQTAPKGRPTPKRSDNTRRRGPVAPAPMTMAEAKARRKLLAGPKLNRAERKAARAERKARMDDRRDKMMAGEDAYLLPRDQGPVRAYVRDIVDSRRNLLGLFMPGAVFMFGMMIGTPYEVQAYISPLMLLFAAIMVFDAVLLSRKVRRMVDVKFPGNDENSRKLGFYAAGRASSLRRMRAPRPRVNRGDDIG